MLLQSFTKYDKKPKARFKEGDSIFLDFSKKNDPHEPEGPYEIEKVIFKPLIGVFMYTFKGRDFACGEMYLKANKDSKKLSMSETIHESIGVKEMHESFKVPDPIANAVRNCGGRQSSYSDGTHGIVFFQPDNKFVQWIKEYAKGRVILDVGCGTGELTTLLNNIGARVVGIDYMMDYAGMVKNKMETIAAGLNPPHFLPKKIQDVTHLYQGLGDKILILFARPSHGNFVIDTLRLKDKNTEVLYITKPSVLEDFDDLKEFRKSATIIPHEGRSPEFEKVWSIK